MSVNVNRLDKVCCHAIELVRHWFHIFNTATEKPVCSSSYPENKEIKYFRIFSVHPPSVIAWLRFFIQWTNAFVCTHAWVFNGCYLLNIPVTGTQIVHVAMDLFLLEGKEDCVKLIRLLLLINQGRQYVGTREARLGIMAGVTGRQFIQQQCFGAVERGRIA